MRACCITFTSLVAVAGLAASFAVAQPPAEKAKPAEKVKAPAPGAKPTAQPPAMSPEEAAMMKAMMEAATPGKEHEVLLKGVGTWEGKTKQWSAPDTTPTEGTSSAVTTSIMDGRFIKCEVKGDMMGMPFHGTGVYGFDNVVHQYQAFWIDNMGTGMMNGTGELSADGKTMTWTMHYNCPVAKKNVVMREVDTFKSDNETVMEMYGPHPLTGKEYKMMEITSTRKGPAPAKAAAPKPETKATGK